MPVFNYVAKNQDGKILKGSEVSESEVQLYNNLKEKGYIISSIKVSTVNGNSSALSVIFKRVKVKDIAVFCRQFSTIIKAGIPVLKAIDVLRQQTENRVLREALTDVYENLQKGSILSEAMQKHKVIFPQLLINMVEAGELSGTLDDSFEKMATHFEKDNKIQKKVSGALTYPLFVCFIAVAAVIVLLTVVVPKFASMFDSFGAKLPATTQLLLNSGNFMQHYWYLVAMSLVALVIGFLYLKRVPEFQRRLDEIYLKLPVISNVVKKVIACRFTRTMASMLSAGIPLIRAMEVVEKVVGNSVVQEALKKVKEDVMKGGGLADPIENTGLFPMMVPQMIKIGEESGAIDQMLEKAADFYDEEVDAAITGLTTMLEPAILLFMAVIVGFIVISIVQPMFSMYGSIK